MAAIVEQTRLADMAGYGHPVRLQAPFSSRAKHRNKSKVWEVDGDVQNVVSLSRRLAAPTSSFSFLNSCPALADHPQRISIAPGARE